MMNEGRLCYDWECVCVCVCVCKWGITSHFLHKKSIRVVHRVHVLMLSDR